MEENLQQLEATHGAPASLFERSAAARAKASGSTTEEVVAQWAGKIDGAEPSPVPPAEGRGDAEERSDEAGGSAAGEAADGGGPALAAAAGALSGAALLAAVAEARGMPESLIERSAKARASAAGGSVDAVLQEWAEEEGIGGAEPSSVPPTEGRGDAEERSDDAGGPAGGGGGQSSTAPAPGLSGAALLTAVAEARGMPESLVQRSASARAKTAGVEVDDVLLEWAEEEGLVEAPVVPDSSPSSSIPPPQGEVPPAGGGGGQASAAPVSSSDSAGAGLSGAALLSAVAAARRMPESLVERSAKARAKSAGGSVDDVLLEWAQEEGLDVSDSSPSSSIPPPQGEVPPAGGGGGQASAAPVSSSDSAGAGLSGAALLSAVAAARKMPESLVERSAKARAKSAGGSVDDVLLEWAQEEGLDVSEPSSVPSAGGRGDAEERSDDAGGSATDSSGALSGAALLSAVAAARKMPESLVERSAKARAKSAGGSVDDVLLEWAQEEGLDVSDSSPSGGGGGGAAADGGGQASTAPVLDPESTQPEDIEELVDASDVGLAPKVEIPSPAEPEPIEEPEPEVPASPRVRYPAWLAAVLVIIPLLAVLYVVVVPNQPSCGSAGQLAIDPATGNAVGCDGGQYGMDAVSNFSAGAAVYDAGCAVCHGANGGGGAGPAMAGGAVLEAFPESACDSQIEWITLGSADWPDAAYGANDTPVAGGMPGFEGQLTELEIAQVTLYERVEFGGLDVETAETACGFGADEG